MELCTHVDHKYLLGRIKERFNRFCLFILKYSSTLQMTSGNPSQLSREFLLCIYVKNTIRRSALNVCDHL